MSNQIIFEEELRERFHEGLRGTLDAPEVEGVVLDPVACLKTEPDLYEERFHYFLESEIDGGYLEYKNGKYYEEV